jgi:IS30 family transposase
VSGRAKGGVSLQRWKTIWMLTREGHGQRAIARDLGVSLGTIQHYLKKGKPPRDYRYEDPPELESRPTTDQPGSVSSKSPNVIDFEQRRRAGNG